MLRRLHIALTFLTCLGRASIHSTDEIRDSMPLYPSVGLLLGALLLIPAWIAPPQADAWILTWIILGINVGLTRGLHWDGWADLWDGWGSGAQGDRFWTIVKDSHTGAFGVLGLVLGLGIQAAGMHAAIEQQAWAAIGWSSVHGRLCCLVLARAGRPLARPGLGQNALLGATLAAIFWNGVLTGGLGLFFLGWEHVVGTAALSALGLGTLLRLGGRQHGLNGDFLGAAIIWGELSALLPLGFFYGN